MLSYASLFNEPLQDPRTPDIVGDGAAGVLDEDLRAAALAALAIPRETCRAHALNFIWRSSATQFLAHLRPCRRDCRRNITALS